MFSFALYLICVMDFELFTGRIWGVIDGRYNVWQMVKMLINNFIGVFIVVVLVLSRNNLGDIIEGANQIVDIRTANGPTANVAYGILCGLLIYCAVEGYKKTKHPFAVMLPIAVFVICGFNHCIADFAYCWICQDWDGLASVPFTLIGNILGGCAVPLVTSFLPSAEA